MRESVCVSPLQHHGPLVSWLQHVRPELLLCGSKSGALLRSCSRRFCCHGSAASFLLYTVGAFAAGHRAVCINATEQQAVAAGTVKREGKRERERGNLLALYSCCSRISLCRRSCSSSVANTDIALYCAVRADLFLRRQEVTRTAYDKTAIAAATATPTAPSLVASESSVPTAFAASPGAELRAVVPRSPAGLCGNAVGAPACGGVAVGRGTHSLGPVPTGAWGRAAVVKCCVGCAGLAMTRPRMRMEQAASPHEMEALSFAAESTRSSRGRYPLWGRKSVGS